MQLIMNIFDGTVLLTVCSMFLLVIELFCTKQL